MRHCHVCGQETGCPSNRRANWLARAGLPQWARALDRLYGLHRQPQMMPVPAKVPVSWQVTMRSSAPSSSEQRPVRNYLWIRRPVHRPAHVRNHHIKETLVEIRPVQTLVLLVSFLSIAICLSLFVH